MSHARTGPPRALGAVATKGEGPAPATVESLSPRRSARLTRCGALAVYRHIKAGTTGDTWFWYEKVPLDSAAPHDAKGVVAFGDGSSGPAKDICVGCHAAAGSDAMHSGHDFVYTQVKP